MAKSINKQVPTGLLGLIITLPLVKLVFSRSLSAVSMWSTYPNCRQYVLVRSGALSSYVGSALSLL